MGSRFDDHHLSDLDQGTREEYHRRFDAPFAQFLIILERIYWLEENIAKFALAANMAAARPASGKNFLTASDGEQWHKSVELMENVFLCHRPMMAGAEYAVTECVAGQETMEILHRDWNAIEVLALFIQDQRQSLDSWREDLTSQVREFLTERYPHQAVERLAARLVSQLGGMVPPTAGLSGQNPPGDNLGAG